jgi:hypothetical protein
MNSTIVSVDMSKIDREIQDYEKQITELQSAMEVLKTLKKYVLSPGVNAATDPAIKHTTEIAATGISEFIIAYLRIHGKSSAKDIALAYSVHVRRKYEEVRNNVSNALARLKVLTKIDSEESGIGRKGGHLWYIKK